jgi:hypothetical protein
VVNSNLAKAASIAQGCRVDTPSRTIARFADRSAASTAPQEQRAAMVNPLEIMPVIALVFAIMCIPILGDRP